MNADNYWACAGCGAEKCSDNDTDCGHDDSPTCSDCCPLDHADEIARDNYRAELAHRLARWGMDGAA